MIRRSLILVSALASVIPSNAQEPAVRVDPPKLGGSRPVEGQTEKAVIRDYLQSWKNFQSALDQNRSDLLDPDFVGTAHDKLARTIEDQIRIGVHTRYQDRSHELQIVFYSPEGLSLQMTDTVEYDQEVFSGNNMLVTKRIRTRYLVVLTPSEVRWKIRLFQTSASAGPT